MKTINFKRRKDACRLILIH